MKNGWEHKISFDAEEWLRRQDGVFHSDSGPAKFGHFHGVFYSVWYKKGLRHRKDGPSEIREDGIHQDWWIDGVRHRVGGPAVNRKLGWQWHHYGNLHREDGPARFWDGLLQWYLRHKIHRLDGPAHIDTRQQDQKFLIWGVVIE